MRLLSFFCIVLWLIPCGCSTMGESSGVRQVSTSPTLPDRRLITPRINRWNPKNHIPSFATPQLVIHGGKVRSSTSVHLHTLLIRWVQDYRLPETQGMAMFTSLQRRGIPSRFLYFANENHWVRFVDSR